MEDIKMSGDVSQNVIKLVVKVTEGQELTAGISPATDCCVFWEAEDKEKQEVRVGNYTHRFTKSGESTVYIVGEEIETLNIDEWGAIEVCFFNCPSLKHFSCRKNKLGVLDLQECPALESVDCSHNRLHYFNARNLRNLLRVNASYNRLSMAGLVGCVRLQEANFFRNPIRQLLVRWCADLRSLRFRKTIWNLAEDLQLNGSSVALVEYEEGGSYVIYVKELGESPCGTDNSVINDYPASLRLKGIRYSLF